MDILEKDKVINLSDYRTKDIDYTYFIDVYSDKTYDFFVEHDPDEYNIEDLNSGFYHIVAQKIARQNWEDDAFEVYLDYVRKCYDDFHRGEGIIDGESNQE